MELAITEHGERIGSLTMEQDGLFWKFVCSISSDREQLRRIFVLQQWNVEYLGIPDKKGMLEARIPRSHLPDGAEAALAVRHPRGSWLPWCGALEGISVAEAFICKDADAIELALPPQEALKFPAWAENMTTQEVYGMQTAALKLTHDGRLPLKEKENGGITDEEAEEMDCPESDAVLPADSPADDGFGSEWAEEADCPDL
ncbi:MAG: hypothetical protein ACI3V2_09930 [Faecousia sp.]